MTVTPKQLQELLTAMIPARMPLLVTGAPGIGKTDILLSVSSALNHDLIITHPAVSDPTDYKGLPWPKANGTEATFIPFGELSQAINAVKPTVWFFDDLGQASPAVQAACMQLFLARRVNGHVLPDCITFLAATNRRIDRAGVSGILEPVKSRFDSIVELETTVDDWSQWAYGNGVPPTLIAFLRYRSELLCKFEATADLTNSPVPRTWSHVAKLEALNMSQAVESAAMCGAVGEGPALEYLAFRSMANSLVNIDAILLSPDTAKIPSKPDQLYATCIGLANRANDTNFNRIATYCTRLAVEANHGEFAVMLVRDAVRRDEKIQYTDSFVRLQSGPIGQLISGRE